jgi:hypothetical protein
LLWVGLQVTTARHLRHEHAAPEVPAPLLQDQQDAFRGIGHAHEGADAAEDEVSRGGQCRSRAIAGWSAGDYAGQTARSVVPADRLDVAIDRALRPLRHGGSVQASGVRRRLQEAAQQMLGPVRHGVELQRLLTLLGTIECDQLPQLGAASPDPAYNKSWLEAWGTNTRSCPSGP